VGQQQQQGSTAPKWGQLRESGEVDFGFGFDDEEGVGSAVAGGLEFLAGVVEGDGWGGEDYFVRGAAYEMEDAVVLD
jgi:hypothetical protein